MGTTQYRRKRSLPFGSPLELPLTGNPHFGAPTYHEGSIYVPIQGISAYGVWRIRLDTGVQQWFKASALPDSDSDTFAWCAFHPVTGILYTSNYKWPPKIRGDELSRSSLTCYPEDDDIPVDARSLNLDRVQGGCSLGTAG